MHLRSKKNVMIILITNIFHLDLKRTLTPLPVALVPPNTPYFMPTGPKKISCDALTLKAILHLIWVSLFLNKNHVVFYFGPADFGRLLGSDGPGERGTVM